jgi:hypothetical protein
MRPLLPQIPSALLILALLAGCSRHNKISEKDIPTWPLMVSSVDIICDAGEPSVAVINGSKYALNGVAKAKAKSERGVDLPFLNHEVSWLFKPNPDPYLRSRGVLAYIGNDFRDAAAKVCK